jgi:hypothetical protein
LRVVCFQRFPEGLYAEHLVSPEGLSFHRLCRHLEEGIPVNELGEIEAKPREAAEPRMVDALLTLHWFLEGRERVQVVQWEPRPRMDLEDYD